MTTTTTPYDTDDSYLSKPAASSRTRRLYTFAAPLHLQILAPRPDGSGLAPRRIQVLAAEGQSEDADTVQEFLVLDRLYEPDGQHWDLSGPEHLVLGVWVHVSAIVSAQVRVTPWTVPSLRDVAPRCGDELEPGIACVARQHHIGPHRDRGGQRAWGG